MLKAHIFLEKTVNYTFRNKFLAKLTLLLEYLAIFIESMNSVRYLYRDDAPVDSNNALYVMNKVNPFSYFVEFVNCQNPNVLKTASCNIPDNLLFYVMFVFYFLLYFLYVFKYENEVKETIKSEEKESLEKSSIKQSFVQTLLINYFNIVLRIFSIFLFYLNISTLISSIMWMSQNSTFFSLQLVQFVMASTFMVFSIIFEYNLIRYSTLMFRYNDVNSHFECLFSKKYDLYILILKILIPLRTAMEYFDIDIGNTDQNFNFSKVYLNLILIILLIIFMSTLLSELFNGKIICVSSFTLNYYRLFFLVFNSLFIVFMYFFYESHKSNFLMITSLICTFIISVFVTIMLFDRNIMNIMNDEKLIYMAVYMYQKQSKSSKNDRGNTVGVEFSVRHKLRCPYRQWQQHQATAFMNSKHGGEEEVPKCHICLSDDSNGIELPSLIKQMKANKRRGKLRWTIDEEQYYKMLKLILKNNEADIIGIVYKTNKLLNKTKGYFYSFVKLYYNFISSKGENQDAIRRYTDIKKVYDTSKLIHSTINDLLDVYDRVKSADCDIHSLAARMSLNKQIIYQNIQFLLSHSNPSDNYSFVILKFVFENIFNDETLFKGEKSFYDFEDYLATVFSVNNMIQLSYNYPQNSLRIIRASHYFVNFLESRFEDLFPEQIKYEQIENFTTIVKNITSNNFEVECLINSLPDKLYLSYIKLSCIISYSLEMSEFYIQSKYQTLEEDIIMIYENRGCYFILNSSKNIGKFLCLNAHLISKLQLFGLKFEFSSVFKKIDNENFVLNYFDFYKYYLEIYEEFLKQTYDDEITKTLEVLKNQVVSSKQKEYKFKLIPKSTFKNYIVYSVAQSELVIKKDIVETVENINYFENNQIQDLSQGTSSGSNVSSNAKRHSMYEMSTTFKYSDKAIRQEHKNTSKLKFLSSVLSWFSIVVIVYCIFFMYTGIIDNAKMNQSFLIKNQFDFIERIFYHATTSTINGFSVIDRGEYIVNTENDSSIDHFSSWKGNRKISIDITSFNKDESAIKVDMFTEGILQLELLVASSYYEKSFSEFIRKSLVYKSLTIIAGKIGINKLPYQILDILKIYMNSIKNICNNSYVNNYIYMFEMNKDQSPNLSYIVNTNLQQNQIKIYELILNYQTIFKILLEVRNNIFDFHESILVEIFNRSFYMTYILMSINFILIFISVFLVKHLRNIMIYNSIIINELTTKDTNIKLMRKKLIVLRNLNKFYVSEPNDLAKKLGKISIEVNQSRKALEDKRHLNKHNNEESHKKKKIEYENFNSMDQMKHLRPLINIIIILLILYYSYSSLFAGLLKSSSSDIHTSTEYYRLSTDKFKGVMNTLNLIQLIMLSNTSDAQLYRNIYETEPPAEAGYISKSFEEIFQKWIQLENLKNKNKLFIPVNNFLKNQITCDYLYYNVNTTTYQSIMAKYKSNNINVDVQKSLSEICKTFDIISSKDTNLLEEYIIYAIKNAYYQYNDVTGDYVKLKELYDSPVFDQLYMQSIFILTPMNTHFNNSIVNSIEKSCFNTFLMYSIIYLCLNIIVDIFIVLIYQIKIIRKIRKINEDLTNLLEIFKIY